MLRGLTGVGQRCPVIFMGLGGTCHRWRAMPEGVTGTRHQWRAILDGLTGTRHRWRAILDGLTGTRHRWRAVQLLEVRVILRRVHIEQAGGEGHPSHGRAQAGNEPPGPLLPLQLKKLW